MGRALTFDAPRILERDIRREITDYLRLTGWFVWSNYQTMGSFKGLSDLTAIKDGIVLFIEVKKPGGIQSPEQVKWDMEVIMDLLQQQQPKNLMTQVYLARW